MLGQEGRFFVTHKRIGRGDMCQEGRFLVTQNNLKGEPKWVKKNRPR